MEVEDEQEFPLGGADGLPSSPSEDDDSARKLFVGGLSWMTNEDGLRHFFEALLQAKVEKVVIMREKSSSKSRGFGFITLTSTDQVDKIIARNNLPLDGRKIEVKRAISKREMDNHAKKIFVGGLPLSLSKPEFRAYFEKFGPVLETQVMLDKDSGKSRGFGFVTFVDVETVEKVLKQQHRIHKRPVEVKRAEPKKSEPSTTSSSTPLSLPGTSTPLVYVPGGYPYPIYGTPAGYDSNYGIPQHPPYPPPMPPPHSGSYYEYEEDPSLFPYGPTDHYHDCHPLPPVESRRASTFKPKVTFKMNSTNSRTGSPPSITLEPPPPLDHFFGRKDGYSNKVSSVYSEQTRTERAFSTGFLPDVTSAYPSGRLKMPLSLLPAPPSLSSILSPGTLEARKKRAGTVPANSKKKDTSLMSYAVNPSYTSSPYGSGGGASKRESWRSPMRKVPSSSEFNTNDIPTGGTVLKYFDD